MFALDQSQAKCFEVIMNDLYFFIGFFVIWLLLQLVILPKLGVST